MSLEPQEVQLQVRFVTKQQQYAVPDTPYAIQSNVQSSELNTLLNALLKENNSSLKRVEFDFIVSVEILCTSLAEHLQEKCLSTEDTIEIEYIEKFPAPSPQDCLMHDDWVSAVHGHGNWILSGCYDNSIHIWSAKGQHKLAIPGHTSPVKAVSWVNFSGEQGVFVSGSHDQSAMLWVWNVSNNSVECVVTCRSHEKGVECLSVSADTLRFATGSWDNNICLWSTSLTQDESAPAKKKSKPEHGSSRIIVHQKQLQFLLDKSLSIAFAQFYRRAWMAVAQFTPVLHGVGLCVHVLIALCKMTEEETGGYREQLQEFIESYKSEPCLWNNLRTAYKKELNKIKKSLKAGAGTDEVYTPRLWYFNLLNFLYDQEVSRPSTSNIEEDENEEPLSSLKGHREAVSAVRWMDFNTLLSSSWDHLIKLWDCELGGIKQEIAGNKAFFDADWSPLNNSIITASADRHLRLYDPRSTESLVRTTYTSHTGWVQSVCWSKTRDTLFLSAGYDGQVKLWETRSPRTPLYDLSGHEDKVLCCDWSNPSLLVSGSCDNTLRIFKAKHAVGSA